MSENIIGKVKSPSGKEYHVKLEDGRVYVKEISGLWVAGWTGPSQKVASADEAIRSALAFVCRK